MLEISSSDRAGLSLPFSPLLKTLDVIYGAAPARRQLSLLNLTKIFLIILGQFGLGTARDRGSVVLSTAAHEPPS
jgi:hypothetical protein